MPALGLPYLPERAISGMLLGYPKTRFTRRMSASSSIARFDRVFLVRLADWLAVAVALALPWSTTAVGITIAAWLVAVLPTLEPAAVKREVGTAAGGLPVLLWCLGVLGMLWADVSWQERLAGLNSFHRLLAVPLLLAQFRHSAGGMRVICGFFISSILLLIASYGIIVVFGDSWRGVYGVPVHDTIFQGTIFLICGFGALGYAVLARGKQLPAWRAAIFTIGALFLINFAVATSSRAALIIMPLLLILLGWRLGRWRGILLSVLLILALGASAWFAAPQLRSRVEASISEMQQYRTSDKANPTGEHVAFLIGSWSIIASAPVLGHGTGSITEQFRRVTAGKTGVSAEVTVNPHNQTFAVAIQLGLVGAAALWAMWIAHLALFRGSSVAAWFGLVVVVENILSSTVHSHLFDFNNGWLYVFAVGVVGGMTLREGANPLNARSG
jgi:O-antigen ligase